MPHTKSEKIEIYHKAVMRYGVNGQMVAAVEELCELGVELTKVANNKRDPWNNEQDLAKMVDELADVRIMVEQMEQMFCCSEQVKARMTYKINRLKERLK